MKNTCFISVLCAALSLTAGSTIVGMNADKEKRIQIFGNALKDNYAFQRGMVNITVESKKLVQYLKTCTNKEKEIIITDVVHKDFQALIDRANTSEEEKLLYKYLKSHASDQIITGILNHPRVTPHKGILQWLSSWILGK